MTLLSTDRRYRFSLERRTGFNQRRCLFIMLNPSTADEETDDPTIRRCMGFARDWGYGWLDVANLFPFRATSPKAMKAAYPDPDEVTLENGRALGAAAREAGLIVAAWGNHGAFAGRSASVLKVLGMFDPIYCLGMTKAGQPKHPLYLPKDTKPVLIAA
jgi:hypothetical protein